MKSILFHISMALGGAAFLSSCHSVSSVSQTKSDESDNQDMLLSQLSGYYVTSNLGYNSLADRQVTFNRFYPVASSSQIKGKKLSTVFLIAGNGTSYLSPDGSAVWLYFASLPRQDDVLNFFSSLSNSDIANSQNVAANSNSNDYKLSQLTGYNVSTDLGYNSPEDRVIAYRRFLEVANRQEVKNKAITFVYLVAAKGTSRVSGDAVWIYLSSLTDANSIVSFFSALNTKSTTTANTCLCGTYQNNCLVWIPGDAASRSYMSGAACNAQICNQLVVGANGCNGNYKFWQP